MKFKINLKKTVKAPGKFLTAAVRTSGRAAGSAVGAVNTKTKEVARLAGKVPAVGPALSAVVRLQTAQVDLATRVLKGERIDKAVMGNLKQQIRDVKELMPYAQTIIATVPAIGPGVSAALGAGVAIASGQPVTEIALAAVRGAVPGGPLAVAAFDMAAKTVQGKGLTEVMNATKNLSTRHKSALMTLAGSAKASLDGKPFDAQVALMAQASLPPDLAKAASIGLAMATAQKEQAKVSKAVSPATLNQLANTGVAKLKKSPTLAAGAALVGKSSLPGYKVGVAVMGTQATPVELTAIRAKLNGAQKLGFDLAASAHIGSVTTKLPPTVTNAKAAFAFNATMGARSMDPGANKAAVISTVATDPSARVGVEAAVVVAKESWLTRLWKSVKKSLSL
jgi:hypothetical protein